MVELLYFSGNTAYPFALDETGGKSTQAGNVFWIMARANAASILVVVPIDYVMATVCNAPVAAIGLNYFSRICLFYGFIIDAISDFARAFTGFFIGAFALNHKGLPDVRNIQETVSSV